MSKLKIFFLLSVLLSPAMAFSAGGTGGTTGCAPGATQACDRPSGTPSVIGNFYGAWHQTCGPSGKWGSCSCSGGEKYDWCIEAKGVWGIQTCECLCCPKGCLASFATINGSITAKCDCRSIGGSEYAARNDCPMQLELVRNGWY